MKAKCINYSGSLCKEIRKQLDRIIVLEIFDCCDRLNDHLRVRSFCYIRGYIGNLHHDIK